MEYTKFTQEQYNHIKENGFNPKICQECQEIDMVLLKLADNSIVSDLYEACKFAEYMLREKTYTCEQERNKAEELLAGAKAKAEGQ